LVNQFTPRAYFNNAFEVEKLFASTNEETYIQLKSFTRKYDLTKETSWASLTTIELDSFMKYDALDIRNYLDVLRLSESDNEITKEEKSKSTDSSLTGRNTSDDIVVVKAEELSLNVPSSDTSTPKKKSKLKMPFGLGSRKEKKEKERANEEAKERTMAVLHAHRNVLPKTAA
jgi:hypothetical protein